MVYEGGPAASNDRLDEIVDALRLGSPDVEGLARDRVFSPTFLAQVREALEAQKSSSQPQDAVFKTVRQWLSRAWEFVRVAWLKATALPLVFVVATSLLVLAAIMVSAVFGGKIDAGEVFAWTFVLQFACFARHGMLRYPLTAAAVVAGGIVLASIGAFSAGARAALTTIGIAVGSGAVYAFFGGVCALVGGFVIARRRARTIHSLSRQEALDRLFLLRERLLRMGPDLESKPSTMNLVDRAQTDPRWPLLALLGGLAAGALRVLMLGGYQHVFPDTRVSDPTYTALRVLSMVVSSVAFLGIGFLSGGVRKALASQVLAYGGFVLASLVPLGMFGPAMFSNMVLPQSLLSVAPVLALSGLLSGVGAHIEDAARRHKLLESNDPPAMVAEMVLLQRRLNAESAPRCVLSVDVARSTAMKSGQDRLVVEWSFREYQKLVEDCAMNAGGQVLSTSGDGAVLTFGLCEDALRAAKDIQTKLAWFNSRTNRLDSPFRVRIGLHADEVQGQLADVQFTRVIDIAAKAQSLAPVGAILVTSSVAAHLGDEPLASLREPVEGFDAHLVVNPTLGA